MLLYNMYKPESLEYRACNVYYQNILNIFISLAYLLGFNSLHLQLLFCWFWQHGFEKPRSRLTYIIFIYVHQATSYPWETLPLPFAFPDWFLACIL